MKAVLDDIIKDAMHQNATDIHITLESNTGLIRVRKQGELEPLQEVPLDAYKKLINYLKFIAELDINEHRIPQSGRTMIQIENDRIGVRVSTLPISLLNEIIVIRILNPMADKKSGDLFYEQSHYLFLKEYMTRMQGLILFTGPTGSGKSTLMYRLISDVINEQGRQIISIEDPVEHDLNGMVQVEINEKANMDYVSLLKGVMRCDPDIIMFGEIRDSHIASELLKASLSGHLVLTTFHSKSAVSTLSRLKDYGLYIEEMIESITLIINQRIIHTNKGSYIIYEFMDNTRIKDYLLNKKTDLITLEMQLEALNERKRITDDEFKNFKEKFK
ncbi:competence type IV pilus ATPase ComGA [Salinicoccus albus]|uniref:competence type IV pilus ATPase ComGA n=1 Tax=Salinicoccus albus TaxID=418756 RepID=UPI00036C051C|nr:competence type IV pilus ATPase ComGA [Salinicoccus albus]